MNVRRTPRAEFRRTGVGSHPRVRFGRVDITKTVDGTERLYLRRWYLVRTRWFSVRLHHIVMEDVDRWPHDHPWPFVAVILRGGYRELWGRAGTAYPLFERHVRRVNFHSETDVHRIVAFDRPKRGAWTLFLTGPERRKWGFTTPWGWVAWDEALRDGITT